MSSHGLPIPQTAPRCGEWALPPAEMAEEPKDGRAKEFLKRWIYPFLARIWSAVAVVATTYEEHHALLASGPVMIAMILAVMQEVKVPFAAPKTAMVITFSLLLFAMLLLAPIINWSTEGVADNSGDSIGAALNITAGNTVELIVMFVAILQGLIKIVQIPLIFSIIGNQLLVFGMSVWIGGGSKEKSTGDEPSRSRYALLGNPTSTGAQINTILYGTSMLFLYSGIACMLEGTTNHDLFLKIVTVTGGIVMLTSYGLFCYYSYITHAERYNIRTTEKDLKPAVSRRGSSASRNSRRPPSTGTAAEGLLGTTTNDVSERQAITTTSGTLTVPKRSQDLSSLDSPTPKKLPEEEAAEAAAAEKERAEKKALSRKNAIKLVITAIVTGVLGYFMTKNMESFSLNSGIPEMILYGIMEPVIGNLVEHLTAVTQGKAGKIDLAIAIPLGSSIQILLGLIPLAVFLSMLLHAIHSPIPMLFLPYDPILNGILWISSVLVWIVSSDNRFEWLEGSLLVLFYIVFGAGMYAVPVKEKWYQGW
ncbi:hypothetical protein B0H14DRAFT_2758837 [Mycena olivaceomarginata]|nr:hypothetical protein B0H14DRAFT_2758837 [Mycena olivaceomarginata]